MKKLMSLTLATAITALSARPLIAGGAAGDQNTIQKIRQQLVTLPYYGVFDNLSYSYRDGVVTLQGQVVRPTTKSSAAKVVVRIPGVEQVINRIEVLPLSSLDDQIRLATYRAVYRQPGLDRLAFQAVPPIHIIVDHGHVTLEGVVPTRSDASRAYIAANSVSNVFSVTNHLRVESNR